jgi:hypothetical protein
MADEVQRYRPQLLGGVGVERPFLDTVAVVEQIRIVAYGVGLASVIKVVAAGSGEFGGDRRDECRGGLWVPKMSGTRSELGVFVDGASESINPDDLDIRLGRFGFTSVAGGQLAQ